MAVSNTMVQTNVDTNKHEDFNLVFTNHGKEDRIYPPRTKTPSKKRLQKHKQRSILGYIVKTCKKTKKGCVFSTY